MRKLVGKRLKIKQKNELQIFIEIENQFHKTSNLIPLTVLGCTINPLSQVSDTLFNRFPINGSPSLKRFLCSDVIADPIFHAGSIPLLRFIVEDPLEVCHMSGAGYIDPYPLLLFMPICCGMARAIIWLIEVLILGQFKVIWGITIFSIRCAIQN